MDKELVSKLMLLTSMGALAVAAFIATLHNLVIPVFLGLLIVLGALARVIVLSGKEPAKPKSIRKERIPTILLNFSHPALEEAILNMLRMNLTLHGDGIAVIGRKEDALLIQWVLEHEYVPEGASWNAVHDGICNVGREMFEWLHRNSQFQRYPDHALSVEALGYAMKYGVLSAKEIASIKFDHGETPEEYKRYAKGLLEKVMKQLAEGTAFFNPFEFSHEWPDTDDGHCCCSS